MQECRTQIVPAYPPHARSSVGHGDDAPPVRAEGGASHISLIVDK
jgi:hypothetical protein